MDICYLHYGYLLPPSVLPTRGYVNSNEQSAQPCHANLPRADRIHNATPFARYSSFHSSHVPASLPLTVTRSAALRAGEPLRERAAPLELVKMADGSHYAFIDATCGYRVEHSGFEGPSVHP
ncbi:hypothetical protein BJ912DRAFT_1058687 [Pholiota molesta]|nr:hypothetical protein BJ912DRAFT_1058687 [Pholiota molesta]